MSIADAAQSLRRFLAGTPSLSAKVCGVAIRPCLRAGGAELVVRYDDSTHQVLEISPSRVITLASDLTTIAAAGVHRK